MAYDLIEIDGQDVHQRPLRWRAAALSELVAAVAADELMRSPLLDADNWEALARARLRSRRQRAEGLMLKRLDSVYGVGRRKGDWWKWKVDPLTVLWLTPLRALATDTCDALRLPIEQLELPWTVALRTGDSPHRSNSVCRCGWKRPPDRHERVLLSLPNNQQGTDRSFSWRQGCIQIRMVSWMDPIRLSSRINHWSCFPSTCSCGPPAGC
jgi:hypothetical protein